MGRKRIVNTARDVLVSMIDHADAYIFGLLSGNEISQKPEDLRKDLCKISRIVPTGVKRRYVSRTPALR